METKLTLKALAAILRALGYIIYLLLRLNGYRAPKGVAEKARQEAEYMQDDLAITLEARSRAVSS